VKISELIEKLAGIAADHGDILVEHYNSCCCYGDDTGVPDLDIFEWEGVKKLNIGSSV
jgi:hypothetical protein